MSGNTKPTTYDVETVVTAEITIIGRDLECGKDFRLDDIPGFAAAVKMLLKNHFARFSNDGVLDDEHIKVQVFLHEKGKENDQ